MDREQIIADFREWVAKYGKHNRRLEAWEILNKLDELEELYE